MAKRRYQPHEVFLGGLFVVAFAILGWLTLRGWSYYSTPLIERPHHADFWRLKPGGTWGSLFGLVGTGLMVVMHTYSLRKRSQLFGRRGVLRVWLAGHIFCGVVGPLLIVLHTSFKFGGLMGMTFWMMVAVAWSGVLGRYLYRHIPRARNGSQLSLQQAEVAEQESTRRLSELGVPAASLARLETLAQQEPPPDTGLALLLLRLPVDDLRLRWRLAAFGRELAEVPAALRHEALLLARRKARLRRRIVLWHRLQQLFYYWHVVHKPFAVVMYVFVFLHIAIAIITGYGWIP